MNDRHNAAASGEASAGRSYLRQGLAYLFRLRGSPEEIARGVAVGLFVALTPTIGAQMPLAAFFATLLAGNRAVAVAMVWITNPFTMVPIYAFLHEVGSRLWPGTSQGDAAALLEDAGRAVAEHEVLAFGARARAMFDATADLLVPVSIGAVVVGLPLAAIAYFVTVRVVERERERRRRSRDRRAQRRADPRRAKRGRGEHRLGRHSS